MRHESARAPRRVPRGFILALALANLPLLLAALAPSRIQVPVTAADVVAALPVALVFFGLGRAMVFIGTRDRVAGRLYTHAFVLRFGAATVLAFSFHIDDERALHEAAHSGASRGYATLLAAVYRVFGPNFLTAKFVNVLVGSLLVVLLYRCAETARQRQLIGYIALYAPSLVLYSAVNLKEALTASLLVLTVLASLRLASDRRWRIAWAFWGICALGALSWVRGTAWLAAALLAVFVGSIAQFVLSKDNIRARRRVTTAAVLLVPSLFIASRVADAVWEQYVVPRASVEAGSSYFVRRTFDPNTGVSRYLRPDTPLGFRNLSVLWARGIYVPTPLRFFLAPSGPNAVELANSLGWYCLVLAGASGFFRLRTSTQRWFLVGAILAISFATTAPISLGSDPARHRLSVVPLLCLLAAGIAEPAYRDRGSRFVPLLVAGGAVVYNIAWLTTVVPKGR